MLVNITGKETKRFRFPVDLHLVQAVGALTLHTGVGTLWVYKQCYGHKKCPQQIFGEPSSPTQNGDRYKYEDLFWNNKNYGKKTPCYSILNDKEFCMECQFI